VRRAGILFALVLGLGASSCAGPNLWTDLGSVSTGRTNQGRIRSPARMPKRGLGFNMGVRWRDRGLHYGTEELVLAVQRAAAKVRAKDGRAVLGVADLSRHRGGPSPWHSSHHAGRDADLMFYTVNDNGRLMRPPEQGMIHFGDDGKAYLPESRAALPYADVDWEVRRFDSKRNWQLVEALLTDPSIRVQWIFVSNGLRNRLLAYAKRAKRPEWVVEYARTVLRQPGKAPHDDHFHVRVYCTRTDRFHGCFDSGPVWQHEKKTFKYHGPERYDPVVWRVFLAPPRSLL
jgi:penicillin-insensitive murein endopeptidase